VPELFQPQSGTLGVITVIVVSSAYKTITTGNGDDPRQAWQDRQLQIDPDHISPNPASVEMIGRWLEPGKVLFPVLHDLLRRRFDPTQPHLEGFLPELAKSL
jgi:hypothetical protein